MRLDRLAEVGCEPDALGLGDEVADREHQPTGIDQDSAALALGPEGGFEPGERDAFEDAGWRGASLGSNVLRFETAAIAALALTRALLKTT